MVFKLTFYIPLNKHASYVYNLLICSKYLIIYQDGKKQQMSYTQLGLLLLVQMSYTQLGFLLLVQSINLSSTLQMNNLIS